MRPVPRADGIAAASPTLLTGPSPGGASRRGTVAPVIGAGFLRPHTDNAGSGEPRLGRASDDDGGTLP